MKKNAKTHFGSISTGMLRSVVTFVFAAANIVTTQSIKAWLALMTILKTNLQSIDKLYEIAEKPITGYAGQKRSAKQVLVELSAAIMSSVFDFAVKNKNDVLMRQMMVRRSSLAKMKYQTLVTFTQDAINTVTPLIAQLTADYNINQALVDQWQASNVTLKDLLSAPNTAIAHRVSINKQIQELIRSSLVMLTEQADRMALNFRNNPATVGYYKDYLANRKLKPTHVSSQIRATVFNSNTPLPNVMVKVNGTNIENVTDASGYCLLDQVPTTEPKQKATTMVTVTNDTLSKTFGPYRIKKGKSISVSLDMTLDVPATQVKSKQVVNN